jgi:hypothetical protein
MEERSQQAKEKKKVAREMMRGRYELAWDNARAFVVLAYCVMNVGSISNWKLETRGREKWRLVHQMRLDSATPETGAHARYKKVDQCWVGRFLSLK